MLQEMEQTGAASTGHSAADFAGILAALTRPAPKAEPEWNDDDLAEDVATLSYESALKSHARYQSAHEAEPWARVETPPAPELEREDTWLDEPAFEAEQVAKAEPEPRPEPGPAPEIEAGGRTFGATPAPLEQNRKCASITVRMSRAECNQLRRRAAEAGLTVSAYLRSCTFEAESLRAQVKQALAEMKRMSTAPSPAKPAEAPKEQATRTGWLRRLVPGRPMHPGTAQA